MKLATIITILIVLFLLMLSTLTLFFAHAFKENLEEAVNKIVIPRTSVIPVGMKGYVDKNAPIFATTEWLTMCYNEWNTYEERITFCG